MSQINAKNQHIQLKEHKLSAQNCHVFRRAVNLRTTSTRINWSFRLKTLWFEIGWIIVTQPIWLTCTAAIWAHKGLSMHSSKSVSSEKQSLSSLSPHLSFARYQGEDGYSVIVNMPLKVFLSRFSAPRNLSLRTFLSGFITPTCFQSL